MAVKTVVTNIAWHVDCEDVMEALNALGPALEDEVQDPTIDLDNYQNAAEEDREEIAEALIEDHLDFVYKLMDLPTELEVPKKFIDKEGEVDEDGLSDWLTDEYDFCHDGFEITEKNLKRGIKR